MTGVTPRNDEELAQSEVECREEKPRRVRFLFFPWNVHLHLAVQTCVRQRKSRLLGMAAFSDGYRFQVRGTIGYDIGSLDPPFGLGHSFQIRPSKITVGVYRGNPADNLWLIRGYHRALPSVPSALDVLAPLIHHPLCQMSNTIALYAPFFSPLRSVVLFISATHSRTLLSGVPSFGVFFAFPASVTHLTCSCDPQYQRGTT